MKESEFIKDILETGIIRVKYSDSSLIDLVNNFCSKNNLKKVYSRNKGEWTIYLGDGNNG